MIVESAVEAPARGLSKAALPIVLAAAVAAIALPADRTANEPLEQLIEAGAARGLALPADVTGVRISAMPDRLLNDQPLSSLIWPIQVRGGTGIASSENGLAMLLWTERGVAYTLSSSRYSVAELVEIARELR